MVKAKEHYLKDELYDLVKKDRRIFDFIQEGSLDGIWYWDLEKPENEWMSPKFWTEFGYKPEEMPHNPAACQDIINEEDLKVALENFNKHCADPNHPYDQTVRYKHKNGSTVYIRCRGIAIRDDKGKPIRMLGAHNNVTRIKELEAFYKHREELWQNTFQKMNDGFLIINHERVFTYVNKAAQRFIGKDTFDLLGESIETFFPVNLNKAFYETLKKVQNTKKTIDFHDDIHFENGEKGHQYLTIQPFDGGICIFLSKILKEIREVNLQLLRDNKIIRKMTQQIPGVVYQYRYHPDGRNYFPYASDHIWNVYEVTPEQVKEDAALVLSRIHLEDYDRVLNEINTSYETLETWESTYRVDLPSRGVRVLHGIAKPEKLEDGSVVWHGYIRDITEKKQTEDELDAGKKRWQFALEGAKDGIWDWNLKTNDVFFSKQWKSMLGYSENEIKNNVQEWENLVHPDDLESCFEDIQKHLDGKTQFYSNIHRLRCKDNSYKWILDRGKVIEYNEKNEPIRFIGTHTDITERIILEQQFKEKNSELEQFNYITSHDLQEPLNTVISFAKLLEREREKLSEVGKKSVDNISSSAIRMRGLIRALLDLSRVGGSSKKTKVILHDVIDGIRSDLHDLLSKSKASIVYASEINELICHEVEFTKLLQNLITNAIKYMPEGKTPKINIKVEEQKTHYKFSVSDNGIGIEEQYFEQIFESFKRLHHNTKTYSGTGIGLAYCKKVARLHNGEIWLSSKINKGSTFYFTIEK